MVQEDELAVSDVSGVFPTLSGFVTADGALRELVDLVAADVQPLRIRVQADHCNDNGPFFTSYLLNLFSIYPIQISNFINSVLSWYGNRSP